MEALKNYVTTMFHKLPTTQESLDIKENILISMEDKYADLIANGKTEDEAFQIVIDQFGDINELKEVLDFSVASDKENSSFSISQQGFIFGIFIAFSLVALFIIAAAAGSVNGVLIFILFIIAFSIVFSFSGFRGDFSSIFGDFSLDNLISSSFTNLSKEICNLSYFFQKPLRAWILSFCTTILLLLSLILAWNMEALGVFSFFSVLMLSFILHILSGNFHDNSSHSPNESVSSSQKLPRVFISSACITVALIGAVFIFTSVVNMIPIERIGNEIHINNELALIIELLFIFFIAIILFFTILIASGRYNRRSHDNLEKN